MGIASQEPAAGRLFAVHRDSMAGEMRRLPACTRGYRQCVTAPGVCDFADDYDFFQLAAAVDTNLFVRGQEVGGEPIQAGWCLARTEEHDVVRHQHEQAIQIAGIDGTDPGRMNLVDFSFVRSHLLCTRRLPSGRLPQLCACDPTPPKYERHHSEENAKERKNPERVCEPYRTLAAETFGVEREYAMTVGERQVERAERPKNRKSCEHECDSREQPQDDTDYAHIRVSDSVRVMRRAACASA